MHAAVQAIEKWVEDPDADLADLRGDRPRSGSRIDRRGCPRRALDGVDPALAAAVLEIEEHIADRGLGPARPAVRPRRRPPSWSRRSRRSPPPWGSTRPRRDGSLTPVEQDRIAPGQPTRGALLESIAWPPGVAGCAAVVERLVLPPDAESTRSSTTRRAPRRTPASTPTARTCASSPAPPAPGRRTVPCGCAPPTRTSRCSTAPSWCPACWPCCAHDPRRPRRTDAPTNR